MKSTKPEIVPLKCQCGGTINIPGPDAARPWYVCPIVRGKGRPKDGSIGICTGPYARELDPWE